MKTISSFIFFISLLITMNSCGDQKTQDNQTLPQNALAEIDQRIKKFIEEKKQNCTNKALELATSKVDSTLLQMDILIPIDVQGNIPKPQRPLRPEQRVKVDTTAIKPFIPSPKDS